MRVSRGGSHSNLLLNRRSKTFPRKSMRSIPYRPLYDAELVKEKKIARLRSDLPQLFREPTLRSLLALQPCIQICLSILQLALKPHRIPLSMLVDALLLKPSTVTLACNSRLSHAGSRRWAFVVATLQSSPL
jgi:hypothetical protein